MGNDSNGACLSCGSKCSLLAVPLLSYYTQSANAWAPPQAEAAAIAPRSMELIRMPADVVREGAPPDLLPDEALEIMSCEAWRS